MLQRKAEYDKAFNDYNNAEKALRDSQIAEIVSKKELKEAEKALNAEEKKQEKYEAESRLINQYKEVIDNENKYETIKGEKERDYLTFLKKEDDKELGKIQNRLHKSKRKRKRTYRFV